MNKQAIAIGLLISGFYSWFFPQFNGFFFGAVNISIGEGRIVAAVFITGGAILWYLPSKDK